MRKKWLLTAILVLLLIFALSRLDAESLLRSIRQIPAWAALILFAAQIITQLMLNLQWHQIARLSGTNISFTAMLRVNSKGAVMDSITPGVKIGGEITRAMQISSVANCAGTRSAAIVALQKLFSLGALFSVQLFFAGSLVGQSFVFYAIPIIFLLLITAIFLMPRRISAYLQEKSPRFSWARKLRDFLITLTGHIGRIRGNKKAFAALFLLSAAIWLLYPVKLHILAAQFAPAVSFPAIAAIAFISYMVAMLPIFPGGLGGFEGTMAGLLAVAGLSVSDAAVITILFRFITFWLVLLMSLAYIAATSRLK